MFSAGGYPARRSTGSKSRYSIIIIIIITITITIAVVVIIVIIDSIIAINAAIDSVVDDTFRQRLRLEGILSRSSRRPPILSSRTAVIARTAAILLQRLVWKQGEP